MKKKCVITIIGIRPILDFLSMQVRLASEKLGYNTYIIDINDPQTYGEDLNDIIENNEIIVYGFNQVGLLLNDGDGTNVWVKNNIPFYSHIVDHPCNYYDAFDNPIACLNIFVTDRMHKVYIKKYFPRVNNVNFVPCGGTIGNNYNESYDNRPIDILFVGKYIDEKTDFPSCEYFFDQGKEFVITCLEVLKENPQISVEQVIDLYCKTKEYNFDDEIVKKLCEVYSPLLTNCVANFFRRKIVRTLEKTGANIHIYGEGWDKIDKWQDNVIFHKFVMPEEYIDLLSKAKICLNSFYWFKDGCNERVFNIMLNGAVCLTDVSDYLLERFEQGNQLVFYELDKLDDLEHNVKWLLDNPEKAKEIALRGQLATINSDTWEKRLEPILGEAFNDKVY